MKAISQDLRQRVLAAIDAGGKTRAVARQFKVSESWIRRLKQRRADTGETTPRASRNRRLAFHERHEAAIRAAVAAKPHRTLAELKAALGVRVSLGTIWNALTALDITWKKSRSVPPNKTGPTSPPPVATGGTGSRASTRNASFSSTKPGPRRG
jgi:transposase